MWEEIIGPQWNSFNKFYGKKRLLKTEYDRILDIISKCIYSMVARVDDFNLENISMMSDILKKYKIHYAKYIFNYFTLFVRKVVQPGA